MDNNGMIDNFVDNDGDGYSRIFKDGDNRPTQELLPDLNGNNIPDVDEPELAAAISEGVIHTGLSGSGCSIGKNPANDPSLLLLALSALGFAGYRRRQTRAAQAALVAARTSNQSSVSKSNLFGIALAATAITSLGMAPTGQVNAQAENDLVKTSEVSNYGYSDDLNDRRLGRHIYGGLGFGKSWLNPDTSSADGVDPNDRVQVGGQLTLGMDINKWVSLELHGSNLGSAGLFPEGSIAYREFGGSALFYAGKNRHLWKRSGLSAFGRIGLGYLSNVGSPGLVYEKSNAAHVLFGAGLEFMSRRGLGIRAEGIAIDEDARYGQLALIYRFGQNERRERQIVAKEVAPIKPVVKPKPAPVAPVAAVAVSDSDKDGVVDGTDQCPSTGAAI